ncbi:hypothetical protein, partial [Nostoc commune]|uniref:hypothetical protein n=1 Tax=Nostoc commune TaxID=1178 RepID=UPI0018C7AC1A
MNQTVFIGGSELNMLQLLTPDVKLRGTDEKMVEFKALAVKHRHVIKNYLNVSISEKLTSIAIAQKLLGKIDLKLNYVGRLGKRENRECVYQFVAPDDERDSIFGQCLHINAHLIRYVNTDIHWRSCITTFIILADSFHPTSDYSQFLLILDGLA